ncbi:putative ABC transport system permease protein [Roseivirga pacifica]|uniref:Putative ABC transport system permease protein n=1 Tax=Roseivirga pacifica TaxID=1267423 RepID=A0A1I0QAU3_9BACT|nr:ABC transporter permease [Roseivirga pacifica]RKQ43087.1 putative ABC transport system permease protein [Roseivirga pacifica]SEW24146.1 putative ABC transport system permease protein [Roseivirga pacifica]
MSPYDHEPPRWSITLLRLYCKPRALEIIEGDAYELFYRRIETEGLKAARRKFSWDVIRFFRLRYIKGLEDFNSLNNISMFKNYFKTAFRSLMKQRFYSFINIAGLALGLAVCLLIVLYISNEVSYDKYHPDVERVYRVANGKSGAWTPARLGMRMKGDLPEVEETVRIQGPFSQTFKIGDRIFKEEQGFNADSTVHKLFEIKFVEGNPDEALTQPNAILLTKSLADKFFNYQSALGKVIKVDGEDVQVTGVIADAPSNTHFKYNYINSYPHESWVTIGNWTGNNFYTYAKLSNGALPTSVETKFDGLAEKYIAPVIIQYSGHSSYEDYLAQGGRKPGISLLPMTDLHLRYPHLALGSSGSIENVYIFSAVALFILIIACINFMNLSTARSAMRSKEVGMRKVMGSVRGQLISQFLVESMLISVSAMVLALGIAALSLDGFNTLANRTFTLNELFALPTLLKLLGLVLVVGLLAGAYPAFVLSAFKPIKALKGESQTGGKGNAALRQGLVAFQFAISIFLIVSTVVVFTQLNFLSKQSLGFEPDQVLVVKNANRLGAKGQSFLNDINRLPSVENATLSSQFVSSGISDWGYQTVEEVPREHSFINMFATDEYLETLGIALVDGRNFSNEVTSDTASILINESAAKWLGWEDPIGRKLSRGVNADYTIVGIVKDFNFESLKREIEPFVIRPMTWDGKAEAGWYAGNYLSLKLSGDYQNTVQSVKAAWERAIPDEPFEFVFLDDAFNDLYVEEERFGKLFTASSGLAIVIACLGLFALAAYTLERKYKEIAVRKVLGASVKSLTLMVISSFTKLVVIGAVIAIPLGYWAMKQWLSDFAYQIDINNPLVWVLPALFVALIAWLTVGYQSIRTASANPIKALRSE